MKRNKIDDRLKKLKKIVVPVLKRNNVVKAGIFGSFAIGRAKKSSDIDILIEVKARKFSLFDMIGIELELKKVFKKDKNKYIIQVHGRPLWRRKSVPKSPEKGIHKNAML